MGTLYYPHNFSINPKLFCKKYIHLKENNNKWNTLRALGRKKKKKKKPNLLPLRIKISLDLDLFLVLDLDLFLVLSIFYSNRYTNAFKILNKCISKLEFYI